MPLSSSPINIITADDHQLILEGLRALLQAEKGFSIIAEATNGADLMKLVGQLKPDVVITDLRMPVLDGFGVIDKLQSAFPEIGVVVLSVADDKLSIDTAIELGADCYLVKDCESDELVTAIERAATKNAYFCKVTSNALRKISARKKNEYVPVFTPHEITTIRLLSLGKSTEEIGRNLFVSARTVDGYKTRIYKKLNVKSAAETVLAAVYLGLINLDDWAGLYELSS